MENIEEKNIKKNKFFLRIGIFIVMVIVIYNFFEGLVIFILVFDDVIIVILIVIVIVIYNILEGIFVFVLVYYVIGDKKKVFYYFFLFGMFEFLGVIIGYVFFRNFLNDIIFGIVFVIVGGIMVFILLDELLLLVREYGEYYLFIYGLIVGMGVMVISLLLFK